MEFQVPARDPRFVTYEMCPECLVRITIVDRGIILNNSLITCEGCGYKWRLNINPTKER